MQPRRSTDGREEDHVRERRDFYVLKENGHKRWLLTYVLPLTVAIIGVLLAWDRDGIKKQIDSNSLKSDNALTLASNAVANQRINDERYASIQETLREIKNDVKELRRRR